MLSRVNVMKNPGRDQLAGNQRRIVSVGEGGVGTWDTITSAAETSGKTRTL